MIDRQTASCMTGIPIFQSLGVLMDRMMAGGWFILRMFGGDGCLNRVRKAHYLGRGW